MIKKGQVIIYKTVKSFYNMQLRLILALTTYKQGIRSVEDSSELTLLLVLTAEAMLAVWDIAARELVIALADG